MCSAAAGRETFWLCLDKYTNLYKQFKNQFRTNKLATNSAPKKSSNTYVYNNLDFGGTWNTAAIAAATVLRSLALNDSFPFFRCRHYQWAVWWGWQVLCRGRNMLFFYVPLAPTPYYCLFLISLAPNMSKIWLVQMAFQLFPCRNSCLTSQIKPMPMCLKEQLQHLQNGSCFQFFFKVMQ